MKRLAKEWLSFEEHRTDEEKRRDDRYRAVKVKLRKESRRGGMVRLGKEVCGRVMDTLGRDLNGAALEWLGRARHGMNGNEWNCVAMVMSCFELLRHAAVRFDAY